MAGPLMLAKLNAIALVGIDALPVEVEVDASAGLPIVSAAGGHNVLMTPRPWCMKRICGWQALSTLPIVGDFFVDNARRKRRSKRAADLQRVELDSEALAAPERDEQLIALDEALERFAAAQPRKAELVKLRSFGGLSLDEAAKILEIAPTTADRWWAYPRAWLRVEISGEKSD